LTHQAGYDIIVIMKKIQQTILTIEDITEHHDFLLKLHLGKQETDDMLVRFTRTFLESEVIK